MTLPIFLLGLGGGFCLSGILCAAVSYLGPRADRDAVLGTAATLIGASFVTVVLGVRWL